MHMWWHVHVYYHSNSLRTTLIVSNCDGDHLEIHVVITFNGHDQFLPSYSILFYVFWVRNTTTWGVDSSLEM